MKRILYVEDEAPIRRMVSEALARQGYEVDNFSSLREANAAYSPGKYDLVVADGSVDRRDSGDGYQWARQLHAAGQPVIMYSGAEYPNLPAALKPHLPELIGIVKRTLAQES